MSPQEIEVHPLPVVETLSGPRRGHRANEVRLVQLNGFWGYSLSFHAWDTSHKYSAFPKFCTPYDTRGEALRAARDSILEFFQQPEHRGAAKAWRNKVIRWITTQAEPSPGAEL